MSDAPWQIWPAPAKVNLFLRITARRADGYHELQTAFQLVDWQDDVMVRVRFDARIERVDGHRDIPPESDLVVRAARLLQNEADCSSGADLKVNKRIPLGGGFGGGSSDAATTLHALNRLWGCDLSTQRLAELSLRLGADVPVFVHGRSAWAEGIGEQLQPIDLPPRHFLLLDSGVRVATAELFQAPDLTRNAAPLKMADFVSGGAFAGANAFEPVIRRRSAAIMEALDALAEFAPTHLTGTGGGCFAIFADRAAADAAARVLASRWSVRVARGLNRSPLLDRVAESEH